MKKEILISAIQLHHAVTLQYHGYSRTVEPHCYGQAADGSEKLRCWQVSGGSESGERHGWKLLNVNEIHSASMSESTFSSARPGYKRGDTAMQRIYAQL